MRIGKYPVASCVLLGVICARLVTRFFFPQNYVALSPVFDGILLGAIIIFLLYYVKIWVGAWFNNRREEADQQ